MPACGSHDSPHGLWEPLSSLFKPISQTMATSLTRDKLVEDTVDQEQTTMDKRLVTLSAFFPSTGEQFSETAWLTFGCLRRFLTASGNNVKKALNRLRTVIEWKNANNVWNILQPWSMSARVIQNAAKSGHLHVLRKTNNNGLAGVVYRPGVVTGGNDDEQLRLLIYTMERACFVAGENKDSSSLWMHQRPLSATCLPFG